MEKKIVDARGLACPLPVVNAKKAVGEFREDGVLTVLVDNEIAVQNLKKFAGQKGLAASGEKKAEKEYEVTIQVVLAADAATAGAATGGAGGIGTAGAMETGVAGSHRTAGATDPGQADGSASCAPDIRRKGMVVVLSANVMGNGEAKLGKALMKAFVFALTKQDILPETILCYNSGAYLTCQGSESLEDFRELEAEGVNILTCGTCLDFYGIKENLAVGSVTNMYEIVEVMEQAGSIVRP
jgi:selenium metabolism protein YedF